ncbi:MAG: hypothetical protein ACLFPD_04395 [Desulfosudaceae bacterium]
MQNHEFTTSHKNRYIAGLIIVLIAAAAGYVGYLQIMKWHRAQVRSALAQEEKKTAELADRISRLEQQLETAAASDQPQETASEQRIAQVFGDPPEKKPTGLSGTSPCERLEQKIEAFFTYLDQQKFLADTDMADKSTRQVFEEMIRDLSATPPIIVGETRDIVSLRRNQAHFFRILKKERLELVRQILNTEADVLEHALANFYAYYVDPDDCAKQGQLLLSLDTLYEYASFFLNTLSGKSYLMRRDSPLRSLTRYYSVLIVDQANQARQNRYGINILPHIKLTLDDIGNQKTLTYQQAYIDKLMELQKKYQ